MLGPDAYPDFWIELKSGRKLKLQALAMEASYNDRFELGCGESLRETIVERKRLRVEEMIGIRKTHVMPMVCVNKFSKDPPRIANTSVTVWLSSGPISPGALCSELVVLLFVDYKRHTPLECLLEERLRDLDWESLAEDIAEETKELFHDPWLDLSAH